MNATDGSVRVLFAGGGTGGHLFPGIAVAREVRRRVHGAEVRFAGSGRPLEMEVLARERLPLERVRAVGLVGRSPWAVVRGLAKLPAAFFDALGVLRRFRPDLVVGLGGYSSGPVVLLASLTGRPTLLLEQNAIPGVTNRLLARVVRAAAVTYEETLGHFRTGAFVSGNPVRTGFFEAPAPRAVLDEPRVLVLGGSQGAHAINMAMVEAAPTVARTHAALRLVHQSGEADLERVRDGYRTAGVVARVEPFLDRIEEDMSDADIVVCRAGATTLAELAAAGRPAILIPFPHAANDHQRANAMAVTRAGGAEIIDPDELSADVLAQRLLAVIADNPRRISMAEASRRQGKPDAASLIVDRMELLWARR